MNTRRPAGVALAKSLAAKLHEILGSVPWLKGWEVSVNPAAFEKAFDLLATIPLPTENRV